MLRLSSDILTRLPWRHRRTAVDQSLALAPAVTAFSELYTLSGYTEWRARMFVWPVFVKWRWAKMGDLLIALNPEMLTTNMFISGNEHIVSRARNAAHLFEWIETLPWRPEVERIIVPFRRKYADTPRQSCRPPTCR